MFDSYESSSNSHSRHTEQEDEDDDDDDEDVEFFEAEIESEFAGMFQNEEEIRIGHSKHTGPIPLGNAYPSFGNL